MDNRNDNQRSPSLRAKSLGRPTGSTIEAQVTSERSSHRLRFIREQVWTALETGDMVRYSLLFQVHRRVAIKTLDDWNTEQKKIAKRSVDKEARHVAADQCDVEITNDPKGLGQFGDNSGDCIVVRINQYGET